ncbi:MAG: hypothetical protein BSOLF_1164 [Candidatus Carbobacillus altaicus]|uniref:Uncharacterized protein n=1 Tax=Candidatus Carbonibacillus altaicus TaxID=2163959 RepID=A0A2R6Y4K8_9BACL|nr:MAG: hypothetical protein BSOLF_1164 [Candidatus Carbobacillus altaicus]
MLKTYELIRRNGSVNVFVTFIEFIRDVGGGHPLCTLFVAG